MRRHLNIRLTACLLAIVALLGVAVHFVHGYQVKRNAATLLEQADLAKQDGSLDDERTILARYLGFVPNDTAVLVRYGLLLDDAARHDKKRLSWLWQAYLVYHQVLHLDPGNEEIRRRVAKLALDIGRFPDARDHLNTLLVTHPNDAELQAELGRSDEGVGDFPKAAEAYDTARKLDPHDLNSYWRLAVLNRQQLANPGKADGLMDEMVKNNQQSAQARSIRAQYWLAFPGTDSKALQEAEDDIKAAKKLVLPQDEEEKNRVETDIMITSARVAEAKGERQEARHWLQEGLKRQPTNEALYVELVTLELRDNRLKEARAWAERGRTALPEDKQANVLYSLAEVDLRSGNLDDVQSRLEQLKKAAGSDDARSGLLEATLLVAKKQWAEAANKLENLRAQFSRTPEQASRLNMLLAQCYVALGNPDQALLAYQTAVSLDPLNIPARLGLAGMLLSLDRLDQAITAYRQLLDLKSAPPEARLRLCEALIVQNLRAPAKDRNWKIIEAELQQCARRLPDDPGVPLLQAEVLVQEDRKDIEPARQLLTRARDRHREEPRLWVGLADLDAANHKIDEALHTLDNALQELPKKSATPVQLALIRLLSQQPAKESLPKLRQLEQQGAAAADHLVFFDALASAYQLLGQAADAKRLWKQLAKERPDNLAIRLRLFDLAKQAGDEQEEKKWLEDLHSIEGDSGSYWRYAEAGLYAEQLANANNKLAASERAKMIADARADLLAAAARRPSWYRIPALQGNIEMLAGDRGDKQKAILYFQDAIAKGDRQPIVLRSLVQLLYQEGRVGDADKIVHQMLGQKGLLVAAGLGRFAAESMLRAHDDTRAMELAKNSGAAGSKNYLDHLWLSSLAWSAKNREEARRQILQARDLAPDKPEPWGALVAYEMRTENKQAAEAAIEEARKKLPADQAALTLASCYEVVGNTAEAEKQYEAARAAKPDDTRTVLAVATYYLRHQQADKAEKALRHVVSDLADKGSESEVATARRELALILASNIDNQKFADALALIKANIKEGGQADADKRILARLLSTRLTERQHAIDMFEDLKRRVTLTPEELYILAQLYEGQGNWTDAKVQLITLLNSAAGQKPMYERYYARHLLAHADVSAAANWLAEVEKAEPDAPTTIELKARVLAAQDKHEDAVNLLLGLAQRKKDVDQGGVALLLEALGRQYPTAPIYLAQAKDLFEKYVHQDPTPPRLLAQAAFLARQQDLPEALNLCQQALKSGPAETVLITAEAALRTAAGKGELERRVEGWLEDGLKKKPGSVALLIACADLRDYQGRYAEAVELYRRALQAPRPPLVALNNLAWLLAYQPNGTAEAKELIDKAMKMVGETPELLDTRATIAMRAGDPEAAIRDLETAVKLAPSAHGYLHLAEAYLLAKNPEKAKDTWLQLKAKDLQLVPEHLHPLERPAYQELTTALGVQTVQRAQ